MLAALLVLLGGLRVITFNHLADPPAPTPAAIQQEQVVQLEGTEVFIAPDDNASPQRTSLDSNTIITALTASSTSGLPIGSVATHPTANASATAILIPQSHRYPGSSLADTINNKPEQVQNQIYQILSHLQQIVPVGFVMTEGEPSGPVTETKIQRVEDLEALRADLQRQIERLDVVGTDPAAVAQAMAFRRQTEQFIRFLDRSIALAGAAHRLKANSSTIPVIGAENPETYKQSADLVKRYQNLTTRLKSGSGRQASAIKKHSLTELVKYLRSTKAEQLFSDSKNSTKKEAQALLQPAKTSGANQPSIKGVPPSEAREAIVTSEKNLKEELKQTEAQLQAIVIDQRNKDAAQNFAQSLLQHGSTTGIIQFGRGHTEGLIEELNKHGITVVVVTPSLLTDDSNE